MVKKKHTYKVILHNDEHNSFTDIEQVLSYVFGWDVTQAGNCANIAHNNGSCVIASFTNIHNAILVNDALTAKGLVVSIEEDVL